MPPLGEATVSIRSTLRAEKRTSQAREVVVRFKAAAQADMLVKLRDTDPPQRLSLSGRAAARRE